MSLFVAKRLVLCNVTIPNLTSSKKEAKNTTNSSQKIDNKFIHMIILPLLNEHTKIYQSPIYLIIALTNREQNFLRCDIPFGYPLPLLCKAGDIGDVTLLPNLCCQF